MSDPVRDGPEREDEGVARGAAVMVLSAGAARLVGVGLLVVAALTVVIGSTRGAERGETIVVALRSSRAVIREATPALDLRPELVWLPGGTFEMGSPDGEGDDDERPRHPVTVSGFAICRTEVTVTHYAAVTGERPSDCTYGCEDTMPVQNVSWEDAARYLNKLTALENELRPAGPRLTPCYDEAWAWDRGCTGYRLPTEAEWEYAARAGSGGKWSFGEDEQELCTYANVADRSAKKEHPDRIWLTEACDDGVADLAPVGRLAPNRWGLYDMHGNVWEWVYDWYYEGYYGDEGSKVTDPVNMTTGAGVSRVLRGGSFVSGPEGTRSAVRYWYVPSFRLRVVGLRCVRGRAPSMAP